MAIRSLDKTGDWQFGNGLLDYKVQQKEIEQDIITSIKSWKNNCFFNLDAGIDWINYLGSYGTETNIKQSIIKVVSKIIGVIAINNYSAFLDINRKLNITLNITTIYSTMDLNVNDL